MATKVSSRTITRKIKPAVCFCEKISLIAKIREIRLSVNAIIDVVRNIRLKNGMKNIKLHVSSILYASKYQPSHTPVVTATNEAEMDMMALFIVSIL